MKRVALTFGLLLCAVETGWAQLPSTGNLFDLYARGNFAAFSTPKTAVDLDRFRQALEHDAQSWLRGGDARTARRRQLVVATIALEAARASIELEWSQGRRLIEWAANVLRKAPPDEGERRWHLAAIALMQGAFDYELLIQQIKLALPRFSDEPRFVLALAVALEGSTWPDPDRAEPWNDNDAELAEAEEMESTRRAARQAPDRALREKVLEHQRRSRMRQAIQALEDLSNAEEIRAESFLRLGSLHLRLHNEEIAVEQFDEVLEITDDPFLVYVAQFLLGTAREQDGDRANAEAAYRAALQAAPQAQSAALRLGSLLFLGSGRSEGAALIDAAISSPARDAPWRAYQAGDFRFWSERLTALRESLR